MCNDDLIFAAVDLSLLTPAFDQQPYHCQIEENTITFKDGTKLDGGDELSYSTEYLGDQQYVDVLRLTDGTWLLVDAAARYAFDCAEDWKLFSAVESEQYTIDTVVADGLVAIYSDRFCIKAEQTLLGVVATDDADDERICINRITTRIHVDTVEIEKPSSELSESQLEDEFHAAFDGYDEEAEGDIPANYRYQFVQTDEGDYMAAPKPESEETKLREFVSYLNTYINEEVERGAALYEAASLETMQLAASAFAGGARQ